MVTRALAAAPRVGAVRRGASDVPTTRAPRHDPWRGAPFCTAPRRRIQERADGGVPQSHSPAVPQSHSAVGAPRMRPRRHPHDHTAARLRRGPGPPRPTATMSHSPTAPQSRSPAAPWPRCHTAVTPRSPAVPQSRSPAAQLRRATMSQYAAMSHSRRGAEGLWD